MNDNPIHISVIGTGHLGKIHCQLLKRIPDIKLVGVYDINTDKALEVADEFECHCHRNLEEALIRSNALIIATATTSHYDIALDAIYQGRHIFIEKPIAATVEEGREIVDAADTAGVKLQVGHIERFNPAIKAIEGRNLNPRFIEIHRMAAFNPRGTDVAVVMDLMIHDLDLILMMVKSPLKQIHAIGVEVISSEVDIANARLIFESGCVANLTASRISAKKMRKMRLFQPDGYISLDFAQGEAEIFEIRDGEPPAGSFLLGAIDKGVQKRNIIHHKPPPPKINAMLEEQKAFVDAIKNDKPTIVSGEEGLAALELAQMILDEIKRTNR